MNTKERLQQLDKDQLIDLIALYSKNLIAMDGVWFQSIEQKFGMDEAMEHDCKIWHRFSNIEAKRIKAFLHLPQQDRRQRFQVLGRMRYTAVCSK